MAAPFYSSISTDDGHDARLRLDGPTDARVEEELEISGFWGASNESAVCASTARRGARGAGHGDRSEIQTVESRSPTRPECREARRDFSHLAILESRSWTRTTFLVAFGSGFVQSANPRSRSPTKAGYLFFLNKANMGYIPTPRGQIIYDRSFGRRIARRVRRAWSIAIRPSVSSSPWTSGGPPAW